MDMLVESSSDEDDTYTNSVARLKAMKTQRFEEEKYFVPSARVEVKNDKKTTQVSRNRGRRRSKGTKRTAKATYQSIDLDFDVKIIENKSNPEPLVNDIIALSSEHDSSSEDENYEMNIKIYWKSRRLDRLNIHKHDSFQTIFQHYADLEKVSIDKILIMRNETIIKYTDTPASLKLSIIDILDGGIVTSDMNQILFKDNTKDNMCNIKIQTANKKQSLIIPLKEDEQFKILFVNCAQQLGINERNLKFYFDGEQIDSTDTPKTLDLEGEACIDLHISST